MAPIQDFFKVKLYINGERGGFSESYNFPTVDPATIRTNMTDLCAARTPLLARNHTIRRCVASRQTLLRDSLTPFTFLKVGRNLAAEVATPGLCNNTSVGLLYRMGDLTGKWFNLLIRGIRDDWVIGNGLASTALLSTAGFVTAPYIVPALPVAAASAYVDALLAFLKYVGHNCKIMVAGSYPFPPPAGPVGPGWDPLDIARIQFVKVGERDVGKGYQLSRGRKKARI